MVSNPVDPGLMTPPERLEEVASLSGCLRHHLPEARLAEAIQRYRFKLAGPQSGDPGAALTNLYGCHIPRNLEWRHERDIPSWVRRRSSWKRRPERTAWPQWQLLKKM